MLCGFVIVDKSANAIKNIPLQLALVALVYIKFILKQRLDKYVTIPITNTIKLNEIVYLFVCLLV